MVDGNGSILVVGAVNTDLVATVNRAPGPGETVTGHAFAIHGGGKGANQAIAVARSGGTAFMAGAIGDDAFGEDRLSDLHSNGIDASWVLQRNGIASGVALIVVDDDGENRIAYVPGATLTIPPEHLDAAFAHIAPSFVLATNEAPHDSLRALFTAARQAGATVAFNATPDPESALDLIPLVSILIVNGGEAAALLNAERTIDPRAAVDALLQLGPWAVALTLGVQGVIIGTAEEVAAHRAPAVEVVDTTGAGDTFCGTFVAELVRGATLDDAARYAVLASALSVTKSGAQSSIPTREQVDAWQANSALG